MATHEAAPPANAGGIMKLLGRKVLILLVVSVGAAGLTLILRSIGVDSVVVFLVSAVALAVLAALVGEGPTNWATGWGRARPGCCNRRWATCPSCSSPSSRCRPGWWWWCRRR